MFKKTKIILISLMVIILISMLIYFIFTFIVKKNEKVVLVDEIIEYSYTCNSNATDLFKRRFNELSSVLDEEIVDYDMYASLLTELFIIDFYTLDNKANKNDVGAVQFVHPDIKDNFVLNATDTIYKYIISNYFGNRNQDLPIVKDVEINEVNTVEYTYNDETYNAFEVISNWSYNEDLGYETSGIFTIIREENKLYVVEKE